MYADVRALSSQGRISTRFEHIAVESDYSPRFEAGFIAGDQASGTGRASGPRQRRCGGVSTAQIMAVMLLEIERATSKRRANARRPSLNLSERSEMGGTSAEKKRDQEKMNKLLHVYSRIIGADLAKESDRVGMVSKSVRDLARSTTREPGALLDDDETEQQKQRPSGMFKLQDVVRMIKERANMEADGGGADGANDGGPAPQAARDDATDATLPASNTAHGARRRGSVNRAAHSRAELMGMMTGQHASLHLRNPLKEESRLELVTDNIFTSPAADIAIEAQGDGDDDGEEMQAVDGDTMRKIMERAVKSRIYNKLDFMAGFFREGTVSHHMAKSKARVVWFNDWYPASELTYGVCVEAPKKRVTVIFRGAITTKDWTKALDFMLVTVPNPIDGGSQTVDLHRGFYSYLFRRRKDTGTTKYHQIAEVAHRIGVENFGEGYNLMVCGHSLGAALSTVFSFWASADPRFTRNGPVRVFSFGSPYVGSHDFADSWRAQEEAGKLQYARFKNHNDLVSYGPDSNLRRRKRGNAYRHVGLGCSIYPVPRHLAWMRRGFEPDISYVPNETPSKAYWRGVRDSAIFHVGLFWTIKGRHTLQELIKRVADGKEEELRGGQKKGCGFELMNKSLTELYAEKAGIS